MRNRLRFYCYIQCYVETCRMMISSNQMAWQLQATEMFWGHAKNCKCKLEENVRGKRMPSLKRSLKIHKSLNFEFDSDEYQKYGKSDYCRLRYFSWAYTKCAYLIAQHSQTFFCLKQSFFCNIWSCRILYFLYIMTVNLALLPFKDSRVAPKSWFWNISADERKSHSSRKPRSGQTYYWRKKRPWPAPVLKNK